MRMRKQEMCVCDPDLLAVATLLWQIFEECWSWDGPNVEGNTTPVTQRWGLPPAPSPACASGLLFTG